MSRLLGSGMHVITERSSGGWRYTEWADGTCQWHMSFRDDFVHTIEREKQAPSFHEIRKQWHIVDRMTPANGRYPVIVAGPFPTLKAAKAALLLIN